MASDLVRNARFGDGSGPGEIRIPRHRYRLSRPRCRPTYRILRCGTALVFGAASSANTRISLRAPPRSQGATTGFLFACRQQRYRIASQFFLPNVETHRNTVGKRGPCNGHTLPCFHHHRPLFGERHRHRLSVHLRAGDIEHRLVTVSHGFSGTFASRPRSSIAPGRNSPIAKAESGACRIAAGSGSCYPARCQRDEQFHIWFGGSVATRSRCASRMSGSSALASYRFWKSVASRSG